MTNDDALWKNVDQQVRFACRWSPNSFFAAFDFFFFALFLSYFAAFFSNFFSNYSCCLPNWSITTTKMSNFETIESKQKSLFNGYVRLEVRKKTTEMV